jgi:hypothetical protein
MSSLEAAAIYRDEERHCFASWRNLLILLYADSPTALDLRARIPLILELVRTYPGGGGYLSVLDVKFGISRVPDAESRAETRRQLDAHPEVLRFGAVVIEGGGVAASVSRAIVTTTNTLLRKRHQFQVFSSVPAAATWVAARLDPGDVVARPVDGGALAGVIADLRSRARCRRPEEG